MLYISVYSILLHASTVNFCHHQEGYWFTKRIKGRGLPDDGRSGQPKHTAISNKHSYTKSIKLCFSDNKKSTLD